DRPRRAGVSSFGISGTNAHLILEEAPAVQHTDTDAQTGTAPEADSAAPAGPAPAASLPILLSAHTPQALRDLAGRLHDHLTRSPDTDPYSLAHALATTRAPHRHRAVVLAADRPTLLASLRALGEGDPDPSTTITGTAVTGAGADPAGTVFVFPGQGSQWAGMALELLETSAVFRERMHECAAALDQFTEWSLLDVLTGAPGAPGLDRVDVVQPALFAVMVALAALWEAHGVRPDAVAGHSQGEIAAACVAGALTLTDAARVIALRSQALAGLAGTGGMVSVARPADDVEEIIGRWGDRLTVAAVNSPTSVVVSGDPQALHELLADCETAGIRARRIPVDYASHSPHVEAVRDDLAELLAAVAPQPSAIPFHSAVTGDDLDTTRLDGTYWYRNLRQPVRLDQAVRALLDRGHRTFIEVSAHPVLTMALDETFADAAPAQPGNNPAALCLGTLRRDDGGWDRFLAALAEGWAHGLDVSWPTVFTDRPRQTVDLPTYPFQHESYWLKPAARTGTDVTATGLASAGHPLLGALVTSADTDVFLLSGLLSPRTHPWLSDHAVAGTTLLPGTAFLELALQAGRSADCAVVEDLTVLAPMVFPEDGARHVQVEVGPQDPDGRRPLTIHSRPAGHTGATDGTAGEVSWTKHAEGRLIPESPEPGDPFGTWPPPGARAVEHPDPYHRLAARGYDYGSAFQGLRALWRHADELYAEVELDETEAAEADRFLVHPALLDAAMHPVILGDEPDEGAEAAMPAVPFAFGTVTVHATGADRLRIRLRRDTASGEVALTAADTRGRPVVSVRSITLRPFEPRSVASPAGAVYRTAWEPLATPAASDAEAAPETTVLWVPASDAGDPVAAVHEAVAEALQRVQEGVAEDRVLVVVVCSGDLAGAAVGGLVRSVQAERPGRVVLVETEGSVEPARSLLAGVVAGGEPHVRLGVDGVVRVPRLVAVAESGSGSVVGSGAGAGRGSESGSGVGLAPGVDPGLGVGSGVGSGLVFGSGGTVLVTGGSGVLGG
ncbi:acyltransferase domain-containing protein, partial [Streptomyces sulfonofaciens]|uniref:acyltransferase domain-containing protein n=1 Tax=Streptomyces sulfonofaciens TaxID=68272 RepID=UPI001675DC26